MSAQILTFPSSRAFAIRVEHERDGLGWFVLTHDREHAWLHGGFHTALADAYQLAVIHGVWVTSSAGVAL
jgi:hypothetical protein